MTAALTEFKMDFEGDFFFDHLHKNLYATDASVYRSIPLAVAYPRTEKDLQRLIQFASANKSSLIPRSAGTSLAGQCVGEGIVVDVSRYYTEIRSLDIEKRTVTVQPGVIRDELNAYLEPYGLFFGPNTSTSNRCMIGGMVGNNSSGTTSIQYGVTRDRVLKLKTVLSNGESAVFEPLSAIEFMEKTKVDNLEGHIYKTLFKELSSEEVQREIRAQFPKPEIHRRNTGYAVDALLNTEIFSSVPEKLNVCKLLCGSEGTLAFTTEITLQLDALPPPKSAMIVAQYASLEACLEDVLVAMKHGLYTCELMDDIILERTRKNKMYEPYRFFVEDNPKALLMLELKAESEDVLSKNTKALLDALASTGRSYARPVLTGTQIELAMELRKAGLGLLGNMVGDRKAVACIEDTAVALEDLPSFISDFTALMKKYDQKAVYYAHAGAGELHLRPILNLKSTEGVHYFRKITTEVAKLTKRYRGSFSGEHGDGIVRGEFLPLLIGEQNYQLLKRIKAAFDPENVFNPGKIIDPKKMDESLRYAADRQEPQIETLLDFSATEGILKLAENCNGSGDCRKTEKSNGTMCPSYHATRDEKDTTRGRANMLREVLTNNTALNKFDSIELKETFDLCLSCKACASECPSNVDIASAKAEFEYQYRQLHGTTRATKLFAKSSIYNKKASKYPRLSNFIIKNPITSFLLKKYGGIAPDRSIPNISSISFSKWYQNAIIKELKINRKVFLFIDEFSNYLEANIAEDAFMLLDGLGYEVEVIDQLDSGRALISKGFLEEAKLEVDKNIALLKDQVSSQSPLLGIEPSAILGFRDEYLKLASNKEAAERLAKNCFLIEEFLASEIANGTIKSDQFTSESKDIKIHVHCHQKALSNQKVTFDILNLPKNYTPRIISSGCCGMAGSFGYEKAHYELSMKIGGLKLFPTIKKEKEDTLLAANGTSCRHQIKDGTGRSAMHPVTILRNALLG